MKCEKCGNEIADNSVFCDNCGNKLPKQQKKFCGNCGAEIHNDAEFCGNCGFSVKNGIFPAENIHSDNDVPLKKKSKTPLIIIVLVIIIALLSAALAGYVIYDRQKGNDEVQLVSEEQSEQYSDGNKTQMDKTENEELPQTTSIPETTSKSVEEDLEEKTTVQVDNSGYATYFSSVYKFECKYPSWFNVQSNEGAYFTCLSTDGIGRMDISGSSDYGNTVQENMNNFISSCGGTVDYKSSGDDFFAVRMKVGTTYYYRFAKFVNGKMFDFSFEFPENQFDVYDDMINYIYADFIKQF